MAYPLRLAIGFSAILTLAAAAPAPTSNPASTMPVPNYRLQVGQEVTYRSRFHALQYGQKDDSTSTFTVRVIGRTSDGAGWRIMTGVGCGGGLPLLRRPRRGPALPVRARAVVHETFAYSHLTATPTGVEFDLTNTGRRAGADVAQVYLGIPTPTGITRVRRQLKGFQRVELAAGATAHVRIPLDVRSASYWDVATHAWAIAPGDVRVEVGRSSRDIQLTGGGK